MKRSIVCVVLAASLLLAPLAHAETATVPIGDPYTDTLQLWSSIATAIEAVAQDGMSVAGQLTSTMQHLASAVTAPHSGPGPNRQSTPQSPSLAAAVASFESPSNASATSTEPAPIPTSSQTTNSQNVKSAELSTAQNQPPTNQPAISALTNATAGALAATSRLAVSGALTAPSDTNFVTQSQFDAALSQLGGSVRQLLAVANPSPVPQYVAAGGNPYVPYAGVSNIGNLSGVTITNANLTASEIPDLSGSYLSLNGGTLTGTFNDSSTATSTFSGALGIGTTTPGSIFSVNNILNLTGATSTFYSLGGISLTSGCFAVDGACIGGGSGASLSAANTWTAPQSFSAGASTTNLSNFGSAYFGGTATSSFNSAGVLTLAAPLPVTSGGTGWSSLATGYIPFGDGSSALATSTDLFWDNTNGRLGVSTTSPATTFSVSGSAYLTGGLGIGVLNTAAGTINGWAPEWGVLPSSGGTPATGGANYAVGDSITLNARCTTNPLVTVNAVSGGSITAYDVVFGGNCTSIPENPVSQLSTTGTGSGATFTLNWGPVAAALDEPSLANGNGDLYIGGNLDSGSLNPGELAGGEDYGAENTFIGDRAGGRATSGSFNTAIGHDAFGVGAGVAVTGYNDTAIGEDALRDSTSSAFTVAIGAGAMHDGSFQTSVAVGANALGDNGGAGISAADLVAIGDAAMATSSIMGSAIADIAIGRSAFTNVTSGSNNIAIGKNAMLNATSTNSDIAIGSFALQSDGTVSSTGNNVAIGGSALTVDSSGFNNVAIGISSMLANTTGSGNAAVGLSTLNSNTTGGNNVAVGQGADQYNQTGSGNATLGVDADGTGNGSVASHANNTAMGFKAGYDISTGGSNIFLGALSASTTQTGANNIALGYDVALPSANGSNQLDIGNLVFGTGINGQGTTVSTGNVGIGTTTPYARLSVWGSDAASSTLAFNVINSASTTLFSVFDGGNAELSGSLSQSSDERLKTNIQSLGASSSLSLIDELNPVTFNWIDPEKGTEPQLGFIAQQVLPIFPNLISTTSATALTPNGTLSLNYIGLISPIVSAIQALSSEIASIENTIEGFTTIFHTQELCVGSTCIDQQQLAAVLAAATTSQSSEQGSDSSSDSGATTATDTPPVIQINGDNPAIVQAGDTYNDLGATITGPTADLNLGITTYVNGIETSPVQIDTSAAAIDTIDYVATDQNGLTATSTRTVIIEASLSIVPTDDASTTMDNVGADDTATTSDATSSAQ